MIGPPILGIQILFWTKNFDFTPDFVIVLSVNSQSTSTKKTCLIAIYISNETKQKFAHVWLNSFRKKMFWTEKNLGFFPLKKWRRKNIQKFPEGIISNIISHKNQENKEFCDILHIQNIFDKINGSPTVEKSQNHW